MTGYRAVVQEEEPGDREADKESQLPPGSRGGLLRGQVTVTLRLSRLSSQKRDAVWTQMRGQKSP